MARSARGDHDGKVEQVDWGHGSEKAGQAAGYSIQGPEQTPFLITSGKQTAHRRNKQPAAGRKEAEAGSRQKIIHQRWSC